MSIRIRGETKAGKVGNSSRLGSGDYSASKYPKVGKAGKSGDSPLYWR